MSLRRYLIVASILALAMAACSSDSGGSAVSSGTTSPPAETSSTPPPTTSPASGGSGETEIETEHAALGTILVDADGNTLYYFLQDTGDTSTCTGDCAATWPAFTANSGDVKAGDGADGSLLGTTQRDDGNTQVTYNGHPLYHFSGDQAPGDTNGQGIGGIWYVVSPAGKPIKG